MNKTQSPASRTYPAWGTRALGSPWLAGILALLEIVLGFILLGFPFLLGLSTVCVFGFVLTVAGLIRLIQGIIHHRGRVWNILAAVLYLAIGALAVFRPVLSMEWWTLLIGACLLAGGALRMLVAISMWDIPGRFWRFFNAIVSLVLGGMICWGWPGSSVWLIGTLIAVEMVFSGWTLLFMAIAPETSVPRRAS